MISVAGVLKTAAVMFLAGQSVGQERPLSPQSCSLNAGGQCGLFNNPIEPHHIPLVSPEMVEWTSLTAQLKKAYSFNPNTDRGIAKSNTHIRQFLVDDLGATPKEMLAFDRALNDKVGSVLLKKTLLALFLKGGLSTVKTGIRPGLILELHNSTLDSTDRLTLSLIQLIAKRFGMSATHQMQSDSTLQIVLYNEDQLFSRLSRSDVTPSNLAQLLIKDHEVRGIAAGIHPDEFLKSSFDVSPDPCGPSGYIPEPLARKASYWSGYGWEIRLPKGATPKLLDESVHRETCDQLIKNANTFVDGIEPQLDALFFPSKK